jgi:hydrogenase expression/formation protein HypC
VNGDLLAAAECGSDHCITCGDDGIPMKILEEAGDGLFLCADGDGGRSEVDAALVAPVGLGDEVLVHAGVALVKL